MTKKTARCLGLALCLASAITMVWLVVLLLDFFVKLDEIVKQLGIGG